MNINRPISPHLTIYSIDFLTVFSIMHRITGAAISSALLFFVLLLKICSYNVSYYCIYSLTYSLNQYTGFLLLSIGFLLIFATMYHLTTGIRHLVWDTGNYLELENMYASVYFVAGTASLLTLIVWFLF